MRRAFLISAALLLAGAARAQGKPADEHFFMDLFLPAMIAFGVLLVVLVVAANVVGARRRADRLRPPLFDPTLGPPPGSAGVGPIGAPRVVSRKTTTTSADGSVTVTVVEETTAPGGATFGTNGVIDPELLGGIASGALEQEILAEVRDAFKNLNSRSDIR